MSPQPFAPTRARAANRSYICITRHAIAKGYLLPAIDELYIFSSRHSTNFGDVQSSRHSFTKATFPTMQVPCRILLR
jgi:hypothetical protein